MAKSIPDNKNRGGRPVTTGTGTLIGVRLHDELPALDAAAAAEPDKPSRPEMIRRALREWLKGRGLLKG